MWCHYWCHFLNLKLVQVASILLQRIFLCICKDRLLPCHLSKRNPPNFNSRDQHQDKVAAIFLGVKARRGVGHPLNRFLVVVQCSRYDLNRVDRPALFCDQIEYGCIGVSAAIQPLVFKVGRTFRQQLIVLEKQTSTHYKNRVHEISDYNKRSRGAGGVWEIRELGSIIGRKARIEIIKTNP